MPFSDEILAGEQLIRTAIRSENYVMPPPSLTGWRITRDGDAEFNNIIARGIVLGEFRTGYSPDPYVWIYDTGSQALVEFSSGDPAEVGAAQVRAVDDVAATYLQILSPRLNDVASSRAYIRVQAEDSTTPAPASVEFADDKGDPAFVTKVFGKLYVVGADTTIDSDAVSIAAAAALGITSPNFNLVGSTTRLGPFAGRSVVQNNLGELKAQNAGVPSTLFLNFDGSNVRFSGNALPFIEVQGGQILQAFAAGGAATTLFLQYGGGNIRFNGNGTDFLEFQTGRRIQAYSAASAPTTLLLNDAGGAVHHGGAVTAVGGLTSDAGQINAVGPPTTGVAVNTTWILTAGTTYRLHRFTSSRRYKENVRDLDVTAAEVLALRPRTFQRNDHRDYSTVDENGESPVLPVTEDTPWTVGFIAEEAEDLGLGRWVERDAEGRADGFSYATFVAAQQVVLREHAAQIDALSARVADLERRLTHV